MIIRANSLNLCRSTLSSRPCQCRSSGSVKIIDACFEGRPLLVFAVVDVIGARYSDREMAALLPTNNLQ
jgi:hypothetical protein